ncbi:MAG: TadE/TadG family type IV pilus assembly protein [Eubacterium sp.]
MKKNKKSKNEDGQAVIEFALVLPIFLLLLMGILDFGWLFYNYISVENSARNAARIACVEYTDCFYDSENNLPSDKVLTFSDNEDSATQQELNIISSVKNTVPNSVKNVKITAEYTYDSSDSVAMHGFDVKKRSNGDVTVTVTCDYRVLTPVLGVTCDNMTKTLTSTSTFKVENQFADDSSN